MRTLCLWSLPAAHFCSGLKCTTSFHLVIPGPLPPLHPFACRIKWQAGLHRQLGTEGVTGERVFFDPSIPGTTASKLDGMLGSVQHVVEVGA